MEIISTSDSDNYVGAPPYSGAKLRLADEIGKKKPQKNHSFVFFYIFYGINFPYTVEKS